MRTQTSLRSRQVTSAVAVAAISCTLSACLVQRSEPTATTDSAELDLSAPPLDDTDTLSTTLEQDDPESSAPTEDRDGVRVVTADGVARPLDTSCFDTTPFVLPDGWEFLDASSAETCDFAWQGPWADSEAIAGELWKSSSGRSFDEFVDQVRSDIESGTELDIKILGLLNSGPSGEPLEILSEREIAAPQRTVLFTHTSARRDGAVQSAVIEAPPAADGTTAVILIWAGLPESSFDVFETLLPTMTTKLPPDF